jgi:hypothetical protein
MSKVAIIGNASGTGVFTVASPNSNVDRVLTLPDETGTVITTAGVPSSAMPAGSVLQVVQSYTASTTATTSGTYIDTGLTATITPISTSSNILVHINQNGVSKAAGNGGVYGQLVRDSTALATLAVNVAYTGETTWNRIGSGWACSYLDSPATTAATTYKTQFYAFNSVTAYVQQDGATSTITLMEIAG